MSDQRSATLAQIITDMLRQAILDGVYTCGDRMPEITIARELNVSQNTVRDALNVLEQEGWTVKIARRGVFVRHFNTAEAEELFTLRATIERLALDWALPHMTPTNHMQLARHISDARLYTGIVDHHSTQSALFRFHYLIAQTAEKPRTLELLTPLFNQCRLLENVRTLHDPYTPQAYAELLTAYGELMTRIRHHNSEMAQVLLQNLILNQCESLLPVLDLLR